MARDLARFTERWPRSAHGAGVQRWHRLLVLAVIGATPFPLREARGNFAVSGPRSQLLVVRMEGTVPGLEPLAAKDGVEGPLVLPAGGRVDEGVQA